MMTGFEFQHDLGYLHTCFDDLHGVLELVAGRVHIDCDFRQFVEHISGRTLPTGIIYHVKNCPGIDEANRLMKLVRDYRLEGGYAAATG